MPCLRFTRFVKITSFRCSVLTIYFLQVGWGTRAGIGSAGDATKAMEAQNAQEAAAASGPDREKLMQGGGPRYDPESAGYQPGYGR